MRVVVAGGTGFVGRHISRALLDAGHDVAVLGRDPSKVAAIPQLRGAGAVRGDVTDPGSLRGTLDDTDVVVGAVQFPNYPMELPRYRLTFDHYDRVGTENLLAEATRAGVTNYLYISGAGVDPRSPKRWYRAKGLAEAAIAASGLGYAFLRPSWAYGPEDKALNKFVAIARRSPVVPYPAPVEMRGPFVHFVDQHIQPVWIGDVATAASRILERDAWGATYEIGSRAVMTMREVVATMLEVLGKKKAVIPVPAPLMKLATAPLVALPRPPLTPGGVDFAIQDGLVDVTATTEVLGVDPIPLSEGLRHYLQPS
ncbi:MAG TPA: NAD(P)H-binding protein [Actinomycetota bacterium]|nr:NAD(P)H-binding protein [Actinomycetota bacterium]